MRILHGIDSLNQLPPGTALSIGNFDGVHRGHQRIIEMARSLGGNAGVALLTFEPHPLTALRSQHAPPRLCLATLKQDLLAEAGVDHLVVLEPSPQVLGLSAEAFWKILRDQARPSHIIEGSGFTFGKDRQGNIDNLTAWAIGTAITVHRAEAVQMALLDLRLARISSSLLRWLLLHGRVREAAIALGRPYIMEGVIVKGQQRGRTMGVPTINLDCGEQLTPAPGVYCGRCKVDEMTFPSAISIGNMPTFGTNPSQLEAHLVGFSGDLYGRTLRLEFTDWVREQWKFLSVEALKIRLADDIRLSASLANMDPATPLASEG